MKIKIFQILNAKPVLDEINKSKTLPTRTAYKIYLLFSKLDTSLQFFENKRKEAFEKYGTRDGDNIIIPEDKQKEFMDALNEIGNLDCEEEIEKIDISLDIDLGVAPSDIALITPFINFVE